MKKTLILLTTLLAIYNATFSQSFVKGDVIGSVSIGATHYHKLVVNYNAHRPGFKDGFRGDVLLSVSGQNPVALKYEYGFNKRFGIGLSLAWWTVQLNVKDAYKVTDAYKNTVDCLDKYNFRFSSISLGLRPNYHISLNSKRGDLFAGCAIGFTKNAMRLDFTSTRNGAGITGLYFFKRSMPVTFYIAPTIGYRLYLTESIGLNLEAGYEKGALFLAGLAFRLRPSKYEPPA